MQRHGADRARAGGPQGGGWHGRAVRRAGTCRCQWPCRRGWQKVQDVALTAELDRFEHHTRREIAEQPAALRATETFLPAAGCHRRGAAPGGGGVRQLAVCRGDDAVLDRAAFGSGLRYRNRLGIPLPPGADRAGQCRDIGVAIGRDRGFSGRAAAVPGAHVAVAEGAAAFAAALEATRQDDPSAARARQASVAAESWEARAAEAASLIDGLV